MFTANSSRREFTLRLALAAVGGAVFATPARLRAAGQAAQHSDDVSHDAEAIHQVVTFTVPPERVYAALVDPDEFSAVTKFSMVPTAPPARIARNVGGEFELFGGHILGRHVELVPGRRVVQAWRSADWNAGHYSIARFELAATADGTTLTFDHAGFPKGQGAHLADGWYANYWNPMRRHFA
jgi:activator of HSP90 ATPase